MVTGQGWLSVLSGHCRVGGRQGPWTSPPSGRPTPRPGSWLPCCVDATVTWPLCQQPPDRAAFDLAGHRCPVVALDDRIGFKAGVIAVVEHLAAFRPAAGEKVAHRQRLEQETERLPIARYPLGCSGRRPVDNAALQHLIAAPAIQSPPEGALAYHVEVILRWMNWEIVALPEFGNWFVGLGRREQLAVQAAGERLAEHGPNLGRPYVDRVATSTHHNMKELRPRGAGRSIRILFIFDPLRRAVLLLGGDKSENPDRWYRRSIREADSLYDRYLASGMVIAPVEGPKRKDE